MGRERGVGMARAVGCRGGWWWLLSLCVGVAYSSIHSPCTFPTPTTDRDYKKRCTSYLDKPYICDIDGSVSRTEADQIEEVLMSEDYSQVLNVDYFAPQQDDTIVCHVAIVIQKHVTIPDMLPTDKNGQIRSHNSRNFHCIFGNNFPVKTHRQWNESEIFHYVAVYGHLLRRKWFSSDCGNHILIFASKFGVRSSNNSRLVTNKPFIELSYGGNLIHILGDQTTNDLRMFSMNAVNSGWPLASVISQVLAGLGESLLRFKHERNGKGKIFSIPHWAWKTFLGALGLSALAVILDWLIVRNKGFTLSGIKVGSHGGSTGAPAAKKQGGARAHMYF